MEETVRDQSVEVNEILRRLNHVERQYRNLKRTMLSALLAATAFLVMGQVPSNRTIAAEKFELKDGNGKTRAMLSIVDGNSALTLYGPQGSKQVGAFVEIGAGPTGPFFSLVDSNGKSRAELDLGNGSTPPGLTLFDEHGTSVLSLVGGEAGELRLGRAGGEDHFWAGVAPGVGPYLSLSDNEGFLTAIGNTDLVNTRTGRTRRTSAASVVLFGKDKRVLWAAA
jgi:hypothetical protein